MAFCGNCGNSLQDGTAFCGKCGAKVDNAEQQGATGAASVGPDTYGNEVQNVKKPNNKMIGMVAVGVVALIVLFILVKFIGLFTTPAYEKPLNYMVEGLEDGNYKKMMKAFPEFIKEQFDDQLDNLYDGETDEIMDMLTEELKSEYGKRVKISYKITDKEKLDKDELDDMEDSFEWGYDEKVKIKAGYVLEVDMKIKGSKGSDKEETEMIVYKIGSKWYMTPDAMGF